ncbi:MAG: DUF599 domain-containing protein [Variovorax sp.]
MSWTAAIATIFLLAAYEVWFALARRRRPAQLARTAHATLREEWFDAVARHPGSEVLAVQTLRNSLMSASITASTAVLALIGTITLSAPSLNTTLGDPSAAASLFTPRLAVELLMLALLFASLASSVMAMRYYNHAGFIGGMPVASEPRQRWHAVGSAYVRRAGVLYGWSLRNLVLVVPAASFVLHPAAGPLAALLVIVVLFGFDRVQVQASSSNPPSHP